MAVPEQLTCRELVELVTDWLEGRLDRRDRVRFERHLEACDGCVRYVEQIRTTVDLTGALREDDLPGDASQALLAAFRDWKGSPG